ncbi:MAG: hypothetical protein AAGF95_16235 [Chloroflexota bacterium]
MSRYARLWDATALVLLSSVALTFAYLVYAPERTTTLSMDAPYALVTTHQLGPLEAFEDRDGWFRWTSGYSQIQLPNPGGMVRVDMTLVGGLPQETPLYLRIGDMSLGFVVAPYVQVYTMYVPPQSVERITLLLETSTIRAGERDLGVMVSDVRVAGGGQAPMMFPLALVLTTVGGFLFLRRQVSLVSVIGVVVGLQIVIVIGQALIGWQYGLTTPLLLFFGGTMLVATVYEQFRNPQSSSVSRMLAGVLLALGVAICLGSAWLAGTHWRWENVLASLVILTLGGYLLLREANVRVGVPLLIALALQGGALIWQTSGIEHYGVLTRGILMLGLGCFGAVILARWPVRQSVPSLPSVTLTRKENLWVGLVVLIALAARIPWLAAPDPVGDLELAARRMGYLTSDGLAGAYVANGDYLPIWLYLLHGVRLFAPSIDSFWITPVPPLTLVLIKLPGMLADLTTIALLYWWSRRWVGQPMAALIAGAYTLAPPVWINVAWWGQSDTLLMLPLLATLLLFDRAQGRWSWACWAIALLTKPQAIILAPIMYIVTIRRYGTRGLVMGGSMALSLIVVVWLPLLIAGQWSGLAQAYFGSVGRFPHVSTGAYNLWWLLNATHFHDQQLFVGMLTYRTAGLLLLGSVTMIVVGMLTLRYDQLAALDGTMVIALAFFLLPTQIHERYLFLPLAFVAARLASDRALWPVFIFLTISATLNIMGDLRGFFPTAYAAIVDSPLPYVLAFGNLVTLGWLLVRLIYLSLPPRVSRWRIAGATGG